MSKTAVSKSAADISAKWAARTKAAVPETVAGIDRVSESPMEAAASKQDKMIQNLTAAVQDGRWAKGLRAVSLSSWKEKTKKKVQERMVGGVDAGMDKREAFDRWNVDTMNKILPTIADMPDMTLEDSIARSSAMIRHMAGNKYKDQS